MAMRDGLRTVAELVDRIEGAGVLVDDVSLSKEADEEIAADISVRLGDCDPAARSAAVHCASESDRSRHGDTTAGTPVASAGSTLPPGTDPDASNGSTPSESIDGGDQLEVSPNFGALSVDVGGSVAGSMVDIPAAVERGGSMGVSAAETGGSTSATTRSNGETQESDTASSSTDEPDGSDDPDERVTCRVGGCEQTFATDHGMKIHATKAHRSDDGRAPSPHRDPERLREAYEACDTFEEMTEALGVDVTPQTVRRNMMRLGVHDPNPDTGQSTETAATDPTSGDTATASTSGDAPIEPPTDESNEQEQDATTTGEPVDQAPDETAGDEPDPGRDGSAEDADAAETADVDELLPPAVDGDAFVAAVREGSTLYEVQRKLDMGREEVQHLLAEMGLLDLVHGRVATQGEREERKAEIERRIVERLDATTDADADVLSGVNREERSGEAFDGHSSESHDDPAGKNRDDSARENQDDQASDPSGGQAGAD